MDNYLECLYWHTAQNCLLPQLREVPEYEDTAQRREDALEALEQALTSEQLALLDRYCRADISLAILEEQALFREAVSLGKWMAYSSVASPNSAQVLLSVTRTSAN